MNSKFLMLTALALALLAGCSDETSNSAVKRDKAADANSTLNITRLEITPKPETPHTVGKFDLTTKTMVAEKGQSGMLMFGPYVQLASGRYQATFNLVAESEAEGTEVGFVDVNAFSATTNSALAQIPIKATRNEQAMKLSFDVVSDPKVTYEFRVGVNGKANRTSIRSVQLEKL